MDEIIYDPRVSWQIASPADCVNSEVLAKGELFKAVVDVPDAKRHDAKIEVFGENEGLEYILDKTSNPSRYAQIVDTNKLPNGHYQARVLLDDDLIGEHRFIVLRPKDYDAYWHRLFGDAWDKPVYLDTAEPPEMDNMVSSLNKQLGELINIYSSDVDRMVLCQLLGPITAASMVEDMEQLPFAIKFENGSMPTKFPHIDLTKFLWVIKALAPSFADKAFFSSDTVISYSLTEREIVLDFRFGNSLYYRPERLAQRSYYREPRIQSVVEQSFGKNPPFEVNWGKDSITLKYKAR